MSHCGRGDRCCDLNKRGCLCGDAVKKELGDEGKRAK